MESFIFLLLSVLVHSVRAILHSCPSKNSFSSFLLFILFPRFHISYFLGLFPQFVKNHTLGAFWEREQVLSLWKSDNVLNLSSHLIALSLVRCSLLSYRYFPLRILKAFLHCFLPSSVAFEKFNNIFIPVRDSRQPSRILRFSFYP